MTNVAEIEKELDNLRQECEENESRIMQLESVVDSNNTHFEQILHEKEVVYCDLESQSIILEARNEILEKEYLDLPYPLLPESRYHHRQEQSHIPHDLEHAPPWCKILWNYCLWHVQNTAFHGYKDTP